MLETEAFRMQHQPGRHPPGIAVRVEFIPEDGIPQLSHMDAQLVAAPGGGNQFDA